MNYTITPSINLDSGVVTFEEKWKHGDFEEQITFAVMNTKEKAIRESLIALGWTPPDASRKAQET